VKIAAWILIGTMACTGTVAFASSEDAPAKNSPHKKMSAKKVSAKKATKKIQKKKSSITKSSSPVAGPKAGNGKSLKANPKLSRDIVFDGAMVNGHYHSAGEAVTKVEQEKQMNDLIGMRRDFKDRLTAERERLKRGEAASAQ
jgi:hypothetical protein